MDKNDKRLAEAFNNIIKPDTTERDQVVMEYLNSYFGDALNESMTDDDIMKAFTELLETADAVREFMIDEGLLGRAGRSIGRAARTTAKVTKKVAQHPTTKKVARGVGTVAADTVGAAARGVGKTIMTAGQSARKQTGI